MKKWHVSRWTKRNRLHEAGIRRVTQEMGPETVLGVRTGDLGIAVEIGGIIDVGAKTGLEIIPQPEETGGEGEQRTIEQGAHAVDSMTVEHVVGVFTAIHHYTTNAIAHKKGRMRYTVRRQWDSIFLTRTTYSIITCTPRLRL